MKSIEILLVEDSLGDIELTKEALSDSKMSNNLNVVMDGEQALFYLRKTNGFAKAITPDLILLDLSLPKMDGKEVLENIKADDKLCHIPVVVLTTSQAEEDILKSYELHANCYVTKPVDFNRFLKIVQGIESFWFNIVKLPN